MSKRSLAIVLLASLAVALPASTDTTYQTPKPPFTQNWTNTGLITVDDNWSAVPGITGFRGDAITGSTGVDPQTLLAADDPGVVDVNANRGDPSAFISGGVTEFSRGDLDATIALNGSGTADAPYIQLYLNTTNLTGITLSYNVRDLDGSVDNSIQPVAAHYRVGNSGAWTNLPAAFVADATLGPSDSSKITVVNATLPSNADDQPQVQVRIMTSNAVGNDEWVGIDNIVVAPTSKVVPMASEWTLITLASVLTGIGAVYVIRRRRVVTFG